MSIGQGQGRNRAQQAAEEAIAGGFLNVSLRGAQRVLFNISGGDDMTLFEVNEVAEHIGSAIHDAADITFGAVIDPSLKDTIRVTLIAAGMPESRTSPIPVVHAERPTTLTPANPGSDNRYYNQAGNSGQPHQSPQPYTVRPQPRSAENIGRRERPRPNPVPESGTERNNTVRSQPQSVDETTQERIRSTPEPVTERAGEGRIQERLRPPGRPQRSLDDLRGLRSMGRRQEARRAEDDAEIELPPFLRHNE
jgi:cell division protein FtsZ